MKQVGGAAQIDELSALESRARAFEASLTMEANPLDLSDEGDSLAARCEQAAAGCAGDPARSARAAAIARRVGSTRKIVAQLVALKRTQLCC